MRYSGLILAVLIVGCDSSDFQATSVNGSWVGTVEFADWGDCSTVADKHCPVLDLKLSLQAGERRPRNVVNPSGVYVSGSGSYSWHHPSGYRRQEVDTTFTGTVAILGKYYGSTDWGSFEVSDWVSDAGHFFLNLRSPPNMNVSWSFNGDCRDNTLTGDFTGFGELADLVMTRQ